MATTIIMMASISAPWGVEDVMLPV